MAYEHIKDLIGKRIKITRGTPTCDRHGPTHYDYAMWIAGNVPVGSTGTLEAMPDSTCQVRVVWDHGQEPLKGYEFGVSKLGPEYGMEEIT